MANEERLGPVGTLGNGYRQESPYFLDDAPPRAKRSAFFTFTLAQLMWWMPLLWARFLYAPDVGRHGVNMVVWTVALLIVLAVGMQAYWLIRAVRGGEYQNLYGKLISMAILSALVVLMILIGWGSSNLPAASPYGSNFYLFSAALAVFFLISGFTETIHALRAGSRWGAGYDAVSSWRLENSAYMLLWNCLWFVVFYVIFFWF